MSCAWYSVRWVPKTSRTTARRVCPIGVSDRSWRKLALVSSGGCPGSLPRLAYSAAWLRRQAIDQFTFCWATGSRSAS